MGGRVAKATVTLIINKNISYEGGNGAKATITLIASKKLSHSHGRGSGIRLIASTNQPYRIDRRQKTMVALIATKNLSSKKVDGLAIKALNITLFVVNNERLVAFPILFFRRGCNDLTLCKMKDYFINMLLSKKQHTLSMECSRQDAPSGIWLQRFLYSKLPVGRLIVD